VSIYNEYDYTPTIAVDLDETILERSEFPDFGEPKAGVAEAMQKFRDMGYKLVIYTCRLNGSARNNGTLNSQRESIIHILDSNKIPYDEIATANDGKIFADFYIDDKAVRIEDSWSDVVDFISKQDHEKIASIRHNVISDFISQKIAKENE